MAEVLKEEIQCAQVLDKQVVEETKTAQPKKDKFLNPFNTGISYADFLKAVGSQKIADYCKGKITDEEIAFIEKEVSLIKKDK